jgi:outer membrane protein assembly factor BamB/predicted GH43/DUF377 family glycosyl hydrolase
MQAWLGLVMTCLAPITADADDVVAKLSRHLGTTPALVVVVCAGNAEDLSAIRTLAEQTPWTIFCRGVQPPGLDAIRDWAAEQNLLGRRVYVADDSSESLWLASDLADAVWIAASVDQLPAEQEVLRVLHPGGVCVRSDSVVVKPARSDTDEWRHPYHGPNNNIVSRDQVARLPGELRFQTHPVFAPMPNQTLFAGGRIFFFSGHIAFHEREEPLLNRLTVLNAHNGLQLWNRPLDPTIVVHNSAKLATDREVVFAEGATLRILDARTGQERGEFKAPAAVAAAGDTDWKWIVQDQDRLWAAFGPPDGRVAPHRGRQQMGHWPWNVADQQYSNIVNNYGATRTLAAFQFPQMQLLWSVREDDPFDARALCLESGRIFELAPGRYVAARDATTGALSWRQTPETAKELFDAVGGALKRQGWGLGWATFCCARATGDVVCIAGPPFKQTICINLQTGQLLWAAPNESPHPFFLNDELFVMPRVAAPAATCQAVDPLTGKVREQFGLGVIGSCARLTVTPNQFYYRPGGGEGRTVFVDMNTRKLADYEGVVRPGCFDGVVPANGRLYWMPLACDCWQIHGTFCMAPRSAVREAASSGEPPPWAQPRSTAPATPQDWPMFRANPAGTSAVRTRLFPQVRELWRKRIVNDELTAPIQVQGHVFVGGGDGLVRALDAADGSALWQAASNAAVMAPPAYWNGRVLFGSCDGNLYCVDAADGRVLGRSELALEKRYVNIMNRFMSAWPLGGGVVVNDQGIVFTAAGSTAADGSVAAAIEIATGKPRWRQPYTLDRSDTPLSFGVQANILLQNDSLFINGGAPVGVVALNANTGRDARITARLEAGREMFLEPDGKPSCGGPELYSHEQARTTIFKRHQGRAYFRVADRHIALAGSRLFCSRDLQALDRIVDMMNKDPRTGGKMGGDTVPWVALQVPLDASILWASKTADVCGIALASDGLVVLHQDSVEGLSADGQSLWTVPLPAPPVRWGVALTSQACTVTLTDGQVVCLGPAEPPGGRTGGVRQNNLHVVSLSASDGTPAAGESPGAPSPATRPRMMFGDTTRKGRPFSKDPCVIKFHGRYLMYFSLPPFEKERAPANAPRGWSIGIAESRDLREWKKIAELLPEQECEQSGLCAPGACVLNGQVHLFYQTYGNGPKDAICHAVSEDGLLFRRDSSNPVFRPTGNWNNGRAIDAEVFPDGERLLLYFATRDPSGKTQMLGVAAADLKSDFSRTTWKQLRDGPVLQPELPWEKRCIEAPSVMRRGEVLVMFYAGAYNNEPQQIGVATSRDGVQWTRLADQPLLSNGAVGEWNASESGHPGIFIDDNGRSLLFFQGNNDRGQSWFLSCVEIDWQNGVPLVRGE